MVRWFIGVAWVGALIACSQSPNVDSSGNTLSVQTQSNLATKRASTPSAEEPTAVLEPPGRAPVTVRVEIADTEARRQQGLMFRKTLLPDRGMLFMFEQSGHLSFWMRNTFIPLDMIFIDSNRRVLGVVENTTPLTDTRCEVDGDSQYVLEVNAGFSRKYGVGPGTKIQWNYVRGSYEN